MENAKQNCLLRDHRNQANGLYLLRTALYVSWQMKVDMIPFAPNKIWRLIANGQPGTNFMKTTWQAYDDFDYIAATEADCERLPLSQFASRFEVMQQ